MANLSRQKFSTIDRFREAHGVIDFTLWEDFDPEVDVERPIIISHFKEVGIDPSAQDIAFLAALVPSTFDETEFLGRWFDPKRSKLLEFGSDSPDRDGYIPTVEDNVRTGGWSSPGLGDRGEFAYAFYKTPYGIRGGGHVVQSIFDKIWSTLSPPHANCSYRDWSDPNLGQHFRPYYEAGAEWWGTFLFTIHNTTDRRLWVMTASTTD